MDKLALAERQFKKAAALAPRDYDASHNLGEFYVRSNKVPRPSRFLERAQRINPSSYDNGYDLALAYLSTGRLSDARKVIQDLAKRRTLRNWHNLLGEVEEKDGHFVAAANELEIAAHMEPGENNVFDWGSELLIHQTLEPAIEVFRQGAERYPDSPRYGHRPGDGLLLAREV